MAAAASIDLRLAEELASFYADPLGFVLWAYPWGEPGPLQNATGPDAWQEQFLRDLGRHVRARRFDGQRAVQPIRMAVASGHGIGKAGAKSLILNTPDGERSWGSLYPGDLVFGGDGSPARIIARHEQGVQPVYRVTFDDGSSTLVTAEHLWTVRGRQQRRNGKGWITITTAELILRGVKRANGVAQARQWEIPVQGAAQFPTRNTGLHPYLMGLWLGDGSKGKPGWSKPFPELVDRVRSLGYEVTERPYSCTKHVQGIAATVATEPACALNSHERYIPDAYKFNSVYTRMELLRGLLDTDGEVHGSGSIGYSTTSRRLAEDVAWLVRSLGGKAMLHPATKRGWYPGSEGERIDCRDCYRLTINLDWNPFTLDHRRSAWKPSEDRYRTRWIDSIEYSHDEDSMCITVDRPDGLYLANDFIVTHNSVEVAWLVDWILSTRPHAQGTITANTFPQLSTKTWAAIQHWTGLLPHAHWFQIGADRIVRRGSPATWFCSAQTCREENSEAFAGQHAATSTSFYIFDEASAIPEKIWEVAEGGLTDGEPMIFAFGNPTRSQGKFYRCCFGVERNRWDHRSIDSRESAFTNKAQIAEWIADYGEDSDFVRVRVRGLPPSASELQFIDTDRIYGAQTRQVEVLPDEPLIAGFDVSGGGASWNVIRFRRGLDARSIPPIRIPGEHGRDRSVLIARAAEVLREKHNGQPVAMMFIDSAFGAAIAERLHLLNFRNVVEVNFGGPSPDFHQKNQRAYMWSAMKDWLLRGAIDRDDKLETALSGPGYLINTRNQLVLEPKQDMMKRGEASPDDADALALTFAQPVAPRKKDAEPARDFAWAGPAGWMA